MLIKKQAKVHMLALGLTVCSHIGAYSGAYSMWPHWGLITVELTVCSHIGAYSEAYSM